LIRAFVEDWVVKVCSRPLFGETNLSGLYPSSSWFYLNYHDLHGNYSENTIQDTPIRFEYCTDARFETLYISR